MPHDTSLGGPVTVLQMVSKLEILKFQPGSLRYSNDKYIKQHFQYIYNIYWNLYGFFFEKTYMYLKAFMFQPIQFKTGWMKRLEKDISRDSHSTFLTNTVKWVTVPFCGTLRGLFSLKTIPLSRDSSLCRLFLFPGTFLYGVYGILRDSSLWRFFMFPGTLLSGDSSFPGTL